VNGQGTEQFDLRKQIHAQTAVFQVTDVVFKHINRKKIGGGGDLRLLDQDLYFV
jgi:hypothetical protein